MVLQIYKFYIVIIFSNIFLKSQIYFFKNLEIFDKFSEHFT